MNIIIIIVCTLLGTLAIYLLHCMVFNIMVLSSKERKNITWMMNYASKDEYYQFILGGILNILVCVGLIIFLTLKTFGLL